MSLHKEMSDMLTWVLIFLVIALLAAIFGFTGLARAAAGIAKIIFFIFLIFFIVSLILMLVGKVHATPSNASKTMSQNNTIEISPWSHQSS